MGGNAAGGMEPHQPMASEPLVLDIILQIHGDCVIPVLFQLKVRPYFSSSKARYRLHDQGMLSSPVTSPCISPPFGILRLHAQRPL